MSEKPNAAEGRALLAKATKAPWVVQLDAARGKDEAWGYWHDFGPFTMCVSGTHIPESAMPDVELTLWLRNNAEALLAALEENERMQARLREMFVSGVSGVWPDDDSEVPRGWETWRLLLHGCEVGDTIDGEDAWEHFQRGLESDAVRLSNTAAE